MTLEDALGRPIQDLEDVVLAQVMFGYAKHGCGDHNDALEAAQADINAMSNTDFLTALSNGLSALRERNLI